MWIRKKTTYKKYKRKKYPFTGYYLMQSVREGDTVRSIVVKYLGKDKPDQEEFKSLPIGVVPRKQGLIGTRDFELEADPSTILKRIRKLSGRIPLPPKYPLIKEIHLVKAEKIKEFIKKKQITVKPSWIRKVKEGKVYGTTITTKLGKEVKVLVFSSTPDKFRTIYHEVGHAFQNAITNLSLVENEKAKEMRANLQKFKKLHQESMAADFISPYAASSPNEDFAETFRFVITQTPGSRLLVKKKEESQKLKEKMEIIEEMVGKTRHVYMDFLRGV